MLAEVGLNIKAILTSVTPLVSQSPIQYWTMISVLISISNRRQRSRHFLYYLLSAVLVVSSRREGNESIEVSFLLVIAK